MPTTSKRMDILNGVVSALVQINGTGAYNHNLTGTDQITLKAGADNDEWGGYARWIWVHEGEEGIGNDPVSLSPLVEEQQLFVLVDATLRDSTGDVLVVELNAMLHDIRYAIKANPTLGGECFLARVFSVDAPVYDGNEHTARTRVRLLVTYYQEGAEI